VCTELPEEVREVNILQMEPDSVRWGTDKLWCQWNKQILAGKSNAAWSSAPSLYVQISGYI